MKLLTKEWVEKAEGDWQVAQREWQAKKPVYDAICFHCQQCVEKYLKALIQEQGGEPFKTHDLLLLFEQIKGKERLIDEPQKLTQLSAYAVNFRYPGEKALKKEAEEALKITKEIRVNIRKALGIRKK